MIHGNIIDTSVLFTWLSNAPEKCMVEYPLGLAFLQKLNYGVVIQNTKKHDPFIDCTAALDQLKYYVRHFGKYYILPFCYVKIFYTFLL
jgi:hypothetical protein